MVAKSARKKGWFCRRSLTLEKPNQKNSPEPVETGAGESISSLKGPGQTSRLSSRGPSGSNGVSKNLRGQQGELSAGRVKFER
jgi:hypothetical protein